MKNVNMSARNTIIVLAAIVSLAGMGWYGWRRLSCADRSASFYSTRAQAIAAGAVDRGWIPRSLPVEATAIHEEHDMDTNEVWIRFTLPRDRARQFAGSLHLLAQEEMSSVAIRPPCDRSWWFEGLIEQQSASDAALHAQVYAGALVDTPGQFVVVVDRTSPTVYCWWSR
jgi:hypothetical protein